MDNFHVCFTQCLDWKEKSTEFLESHNSPFCGFVPSMSFRRLAAVASIIPKRGLEEFVSQTSVAGKDVVYGGISRGDE